MSCLSVPEFIHDASQLSNFVSGVGWLSTETMGTTEPHHPVRLPRLVLRELCTVPRVRA